MYSKPLRYSLQLCTSDWRQYNFHLSEQYITDGQIPPVLCYHQKVYRQPVTQLGDRNSMQLQQIWHFRIFFFPKGSNKLHKMMKPKITEQWMSLKPWTYDGLNRRLRQCQGSENINQTIVSIHIGTEWWHCISRNIFVLQAAVRTS